MNDSILSIIIIITLALLLLLLPDEVSSASSIIIINRRHVLKKLMYATSCSATLMHPKLSFAATDTNTNKSILDDIDWNAPKSLGLNTERMCDGINDSIRETSWLVTGLGCPFYFSDGFQYQSSDEENGAKNVRIKGYEAYCRWVNNKRYSEDIKPQCDLICCSVTAKSTITALWRLGYDAASSSSIDNERSKVYLSTFTTSNDHGGLVISQTDKVLIEKNAPGGDELRAKCNWYSCTMPESLL